MKFEKKEPEVRIQPFNAHKNPWSKCRCMDCEIPYTDEVCKHFDEGGAMTIAWYGESISSGHLWQCAKCHYENRVNLGMIEEKDG
jgi:hypothetical protein